MRGIWKNCSLTLALTLLFALSLAGLSVTGWRQYNDDQQQHGGEQIAFHQYVVTGEFLESVFENWESEFLQMATFLVLSALLIQRGSAESKKPEEELEGGQPEEFTKDPAQNKRPDSPGPVHRGGWALKLYSHSLSVSLFGLFLFSFVLHAMSGAKAFSDEQLQHGGQAVSWLSYLGTSKFWFESFQNWQSEFLSIAVLVVLSIWLRERGSPESKPVHAPHSQTGEE